MYQGGGGVTCSFVERSVILDKQVGKCTMNVGADFLAGLGRAKNTNDRHLRFFPELGRAEIIAKLRIVFRGVGLVLIDAVQSNPEYIHIDGLGCRVEPRIWS